MQQGAISPVAVMLYPDGYLAGLEYEWDHLSKAAASAGFQVIIAEWGTLLVRESSVVSCYCHVRAPGTAALDMGTSIAFSPSVLLTTWGVGGENWALYETLTSMSGWRHSESMLLSELEAKCELELCLRAYEERTTNKVSRPTTVLSCELDASHLSPPHERVIVKPSHGEKGEGIQIVARKELANLLREVSGTGADPFVVQDLIANVPLYEDRRWDIRVCAGATSLNPLVYACFPEGVVRPAGLQAGSTPKISLHG